MTTLKTFGRRLLTATSCGTNDLQQMERATRWLKSKSNTLAHWVVFSSSSRFDSSSSGKKWSSC